MSIAFQQIYQNLNPAQKQAVEHKNGPLLIVAGAGTGKTSVITSRIVYLIQQFKLRPENILAVTFTEKASEEMEERVDQMMPLGYTDLWINTFHGLGERILKEHALDIGLPNNFELASEIEQRMILRKYFYDFNFEYFKPQASPDSIIQALIQHFSRAKDEDISPEQYMDYAKKAQKSDAFEDDEKLKFLEVARAYKKYQEILLAENVLDFGDLIAYALKLLRERPNVLKKYQQQFKFILVDEFQDTNFAQYQLINLLAGDEQNLTVCADDDQAIYKWRGASVSNVLNFKEDYSNAEQIVLTENYRSAQPILDLSYQSIQLNNPDRLEKKNKIDKKLNANLEGSIEPEYVHLETLEQEVVWVINKIIELQNEDKNLSWNDFAILIRSNAEADPFINLLSQKGIPYEFFASRGLYLKPEILDLMAYLRVLVDFHDNPSFYRVVTMPVFGLEYKDIVPLLEKSSRTADSLVDIFINHNDTAGISEEGRQKIDKLLSVLESHAKLAQEKDVGETLLNFLEDSAYLKDIQEAGDIEAEKKILNISLLFKRIQSFQENKWGKARVKDFVEELDLMQKMGENPAPAQLEEGPEAVKIMTIHGAKGLEFENVFVVNMVQDRFPVRRRKEGIELPEELAKEDLPEGDPHIQEERRLFYVALTRAKKRLFLTSAEDYGGKRKKKPSIFIKEISDELLQIPVAKQAIKQKPLNLELPAKKKSVVADISYRLPKKFSYTQLVVFDSCPKQYKYRHILKIQGKGGVSMSFGNSMHNTLARFYKEIMESRNLSLAPSLKRRGEKEGTLQRLLEIYDQEWIPEYYDSKQHEEKKKAEGQKLLEDYYEANKEDFDKVMMIEEGFNVKIGDYTFKGVVDRVDDLGNGQVEIVDYKTGKERSEREVKKDKQLTLYSLAMKQVFDKDSKRVSLYFLGANNKIESTRDKEDQQKFVAEVLETVNKIKNSDFKATPGFHCQFCDYQGICEDRAK
ncbi:UvrD-helicase domain-containing protein [Patescibacteria group bacterium]|nr:UvrD-helicase domain-containing protein [Patescibacteria group bacterium]